MLAQVKQAIRAVQTALGTINDAASITGSALAQLRFLGTASATGLLKLEDDPHASGDAGFQMLAVRNDDDIEGGTGAGANGDYTALGSYGRALQTRIAASNTATDNRKSIVKREDDAHTTADAVVAVGMVQKATPVNLAGSDGDYDIPQVYRGAQYTMAGFFADAIVDANISADYTRAAIDCRGYKSIQIDFQFADDSAGELYIQGSAAGTHYTDLVPDGVDFKTGGVAWTGVAWAGGVNITIADPGAGGSKVSVIIENPPANVVYFFDRTGGSATGLDTQEHLRA